MDPRTNPYTPNAGAEPEAVVGREDQLESFDVLLARLERGRTEQSMIVTGLRGVGKTVLLQQFRQKAMENTWTVMDMEAEKNDTSGFRRDLGSRFHSALLQMSPKAKWSEGFKHAASVVKSFSVTASPEGSVTFGMDVKSLEGYADHGNLTQDLVDLFIAVGNVAKEKETGVVILLDEVQFLSKDQLGGVITALHKTAQYKLPITMVGAGLPQIAGFAGDAKSYAERLFKFPRIGNLDKDDAAKALSKPATSEGVRFHEDALALAFDITAGYPYFIQELGYAVWTIAANNTITVEDIELAVPGYTGKLDQSFFQVRLDRCTELQRSYLRAMADLGPEPQKANDVAERMGRTSQNQAPTRAELISMGLLYTPEHGYAAYTVPQFDQYMLRAIPTLEVPQKKTRKAKHRATAESE
ncbi:ATP-binding protein [Citricoccus nitrophenolicus]|uniref:AAA ATPase-like protein n=1 Tax=Citricoccus muralis TaxID=169134 RepID=A0A3D9LFS2_9MICC|nr:ATP-binding protein [Citricoccus muralis]REE04506.1 AAA ATPase-like protein [Citricoccus muralis]